MALLPYRTENINGASVSVDNFMNTTGEAGFVVVYVTTTSGSGPSFDDTNAVVRLATVAGGSGEYPAGVLLMDVVNKDLAHTHLNEQKREGQVGGKVALLKRGTIVTNAIVGGGNPSPGLPAYFGIGGQFEVTQVNAGSTRIGTWVSSRNSAGYAKVDVTII